MDYHSSLWADNCKDRLRFGSRQCCSHRFMFGNSFLCLIFLTKSYCFFFYFFLLVGSLIIFNFFLKYVYFMLRLQLCFQLLLNFFNFFSILCILVLLFLLLQLLRTMAVTYSVWLLFRLQDKTIKNRAGGQINQFSLSRVPVAIIKMLKRLIFGTVVPFTLAVVTASSSIVVKWLWFCSPKVRTVRAFWHFNTRSSSFINFIWFALMITVYSEGLRMIGRSASDFLRNDLAIFEDRRMIKGGYKPFLDIIDSISPALIDLDSFAIGTNHFIVLNKIMIVSAHLFHGLEIDLFCYYLIESVRLNNIWIVTDKCKISEWLCPRASFLSATVLHRKATPSEKRVARIGAAG